MAGFSRVLVASSAVLLAAGLSGCGGHSKSASSSKAAAGSTASATARASSGTATSTGKASKKSGTSGGHKTCSSKATSATIGGKAKCIEVGQECSHKHAADYTQYGFKCEAKGNTYVLRKA